VGGQVLESAGRRTGSGILYPLNFILFIPPLRGLKKSFAPYKGLHPLLLISPLKSAGGRTSSEIRQEADKFWNLPVLGALPHPPHTFLS